MIFRFLVFLQCVHARETGTFYLLVTLCEWSLLWKSTGSFPSLCKNRWLKYLLLIRCPTTIFMCVDCNTSPADETAWNLTCLNWSVIIIVFPCRAHGKQHSNHSLYASWLSVAIFEFVHESFIALCPFLLTQKTGVYFGFLFNSLFYCLMMKL